MLRSIAIPEIAAVRHSLVPEFPVHGVEAASTEISVTSGIADAIVLGTHGEPALVIDWKSDVDPSAAVLKSYEQQVRDYLALTGIPRGMIALMTRGVLIEVR